MNRHVYKSGIEYKVKKRGKVLAVSLIFSMMIGLLGGCGNGGQAASSDDQETKGAAADIKTAADGTQADADGMNHGTVCGDSCGYFRVYNLVLWCYAAY